MPNNLYKSLYIFYMALADISYRLHRPDVIPKPITCETLNPLQGKTKMLHL